MAKPKGFSPEVQLDRDMLELVGYPAFLRFLFVVAQKAGIGGSSLGTAMDASTYEGRRSLGLDLLTLADRALPGRIASIEPFSALGMAIAAAGQVKQAEGDSDEEEQDFERR